MSAAEAEPLTEAEAARFLAITDPRGIYDRAAEAVAEALKMTADRLAELRAQRARINDEIRDLVEDERRLNSMAAIAKKRGAAGDG